MGKVFNKGLETENKNEGLLKTLKDIEDENKEHLNKTKYQGEGQLHMIDKQLKTQMKAIEKREKQLKK